MGNTNESNPMIVQRNRTTDDSKRQEGKVTPEIIQRVNTNDALASQFPEWDLTPPGQLIRRRSSKLL